MKKNQIEHKNVTVDIDDTQEERKDRDNEAVKSIGPDGSQDESEDVDIDDSDEDGENEEEEEEEEPKESWQDYFHRRLKESAKTVKPNISWYLAQAIFHEKTGAPVPDNCYTPVRVLLPLPVPCLNIWALKGQKTGRTLGLSEKDMERTVYFASYLVTSSNCALKAGTVLSEKEYQAALEEYQDRFTVGMGAEGLLEYAKNQKKTISGIISYLPMVYPALPAEKQTTLRDRRYLWEFRHDLEVLYIDILNRADRIRKLAKLNAPEIIMRNEKRILQELLDCTIANGLRYTRRSEYTKLPTYSWRDLNEEE